MSTAGASILGVGYLLPLVYLLWSLRYGAIAPAQPVGRDRPRVADAVAAADRELRDDAGRHRGGVRVLRRPPEAGMLSEPWPRGTHPRYAHQFDERRAAARARRTLGMWVFLVTEILFFGGLFLGVHRLPHRAIRQAFAQASHHLDVTLGAHQHGRADRQQPHDGARRPRRAARQAPARRCSFLVLTMVLGSRLPRHQGGRVRRTSSTSTTCRGRTSTSTGGDARHAQIFFSLYFVMTGLHALHMIIGIGDPRRAAR